MARISLKTLTLAIAIALVALLPARGQTIGAPMGINGIGGISRRPINVPTNSGAGTFVISNAQVGIDTDGSIWQTTLWIVNAYGGDMNPYAILFLGTNNALVPVDVIPAADFILSSIAGLNGDLCANAAQRVILTSDNGTAALKSFNIQLQTSGGMMISAIVQHLDTNGALLEPPVALRERSTRLPATGSKFAVGLDVETGLETVLTFNNPSLYPATVTFAAYSPNGIQVPNRTPFATVQVVIPPGISTQTVTNVFATSTDFANFTASVGGYIKQGFLSIASDQSVVLGVTQETIDTVSGDFDQTIWQAFPGTPSSSVRQ